MTTSAPSSPQAWKITTNKESVHKNYSFKNIKKEIQKTAKYTKKMLEVAGKADGWDETAVAVSAVLPAYARPAFLAVTLGVLTIPVSWGAKAMAADFQEMKDDVQGLKNTQVDLALRLLASDKTPQEIKDEIKAEFEDNNKNNQRLLGGLNNVRENINEKIKYKDKTPAEKASEIKKVFQKLDIKYDDSNDIIEKLLKDDKSQLDNYNTVKTARDFITQYTEANRKDKEALIEEIQTFIADNKGTLDIKDDDGPIQKLQKIAKSVLEPRRDEYIIKLFNDYHAELENKVKLKEALDNKSDTKGLLDTLKIKPLIDQQEIDSSIIQYQKNKRAIAIEQTPVTGYLGNLAMAGMTLGTALSAAKAGTQLLGQFGVLPNLMPAITAGLEVASSGTFVASQTAMVGYGLGEARKGYQKNDDFNTDIALLKKNIGITDETEPTAEQQKKLDHVTALKTYNLRKNTYYGLGIATAEAGMIAGSMTGSSPLLLASALGTLAFAGLRMWTQSAEAEVTGNAHDHEHNGKPLVMINPLKKPEIDVSPHTHSASCNHDITLELKSDDVNKNYDDALNNLKNLNNILDSNFVFQDLLKIKSLSCPSQERHKIQNNLFTLLPSIQVTEQFNEKQVQQDYINAILDTPDALENVKEILIDALEDSDNTNKDTILKLLKTKRPDRNSLRQCLRENLDILDKSQNAKRILKPLLEERIKILTEKKHNMINNMIHLEKISQRDLES